MNRTRWVIGCALLAFCRAESVAAAGEQGSKGLAAEALAVFRAKCAACHGPELARPRGGFGHVLDLGRLGARGGLVVPSKPDESDLWTLVQSGEMPPPDAPAGGLTVREKDAIRAWIAGGAPAGSVPSSRTAPPGDNGAGDGPRPAERALRWLGKFHLLVVHFPIALLMAALAAELWAVWQRRRVPSPAVRFCLGLAAVSAVPAVALGWLFALGGLGSSGLLALHRWIGTAAGAWAVGIAVVSEVDARRGVRSWWTRVLLLVGVLLVSVAAHFGGLMVHGKDFYDW
jgi:uncharacterized membrane protein/mono/diheme cytochrome c family protein